MTFLNLKEKQHLGITLLVTPQWMFLATVQKPYHREQQIDFEVEGKQEDGGIPLYLDGLAYSGIINLQNIIQEWPSTAGIGYRQHKILETFETQSKEDESMRPPEITEWL